MPVNDKTFRSRGIPLRILGRHWRQWRNDDLRKILGFYRCDNSAFPYKIDLITAFYGLIKNRTITEKVADALLERIKKLEHGAHPAPCMTRQCGICREDLERGHFSTRPITSECEHETTYCLMCLAKHMEHELESKETCQQFTCPDPSCRQELDYEDVKAWASLGTFETFDQKFTGEALQRHPLYWPCSACPSGGLCDPKDGLYAQCRDCQHRACVQCRETWEGPDHRCRGSDKPDEKTDSYLRRLTVGCPTPGCGARIQKRGGCDHMYCIMCNREFSWSQGLRDKEFQDEAEVEVFDDLGDEYIWREGELVGWIPR